MNNTIIIIPARYQSTRFPGKCLEKINEKEVLLRVYENCLECKKYYNNIDVIVALDHETTMNFCNENNIDYIITDVENKTGTDRVKEAFNIIQENTNYKYENVINVQGDEPFVKAEDIIHILNKFEYHDMDIACGMKKIENKEDFFNPNIIKVLFNDTYNFLKDGNINQFVYASRSPIPYNKNQEFKEAWKQVCIYCFHSKSIQIFNNKKTKQEDIEDIELLRCLPHNELLTCLIEVKNDSMAIDVPSDIQKAEKFLFLKENKKKYNNFINKIEKGKNIIAIDFDGVFHKNSKGIYDWTIYDKPVCDDIMIHLDKIKNKLNYNIVIFTCKADPDRPLINNKTGKELIWEWLKKYKLDKYIDDIVFEKPISVLYIDDKGFKFNNWDETVLYLEHLRYVKG
jgi:3-deoxy-manno-octulosonate cytidylyltransferase (CMP-KDO synthetase)